MHRHSLLLIASTFAAGAATQEADQDRDSAVAATIPFEIVCREIVDENLVCEDAAGKRSIGKPSRISLQNHDREYTLEYFPSDYGVGSRCIELSLGRVFCR